MEIKFKAQHTTLKNNETKWIYFDLDEYQDFKENYSEVRNMCQWTGLKDKNGTEIYEGDIVKGIRHINYFGTETEEFIREVTLNLTSNISDESYGGPDGTTWYTDLEVIGNKYDRN